MAPMARISAMTALLIAEVVAVRTWLAPGPQFWRFAFADSGADLTIRDLIARGFRPTIDFGTIYGLLPLAINRAWFGLVGATPAGFRLGTLACNALMAWGLARFVVIRRAGAVGLPLVVLAMPDVLRISEIALVHVLEPALLVHALAEQARGRRGTALALATACLFVKPSMAFVYGAILLVALGRSARGDGIGGWRRALAPAVATGAALAVGLSAMYGVGPLVHSLSPGAGLEVYRQGHYGFFRGAGREFWLRPRLGLAGYFQTEVGPWLVGSLVLIVGALAGPRRRTPDRDRPGIAGDGEVVATCALLHVAFVAFFFGNRFSWIYYYPVLLMGLAALSARGRRSAIVVGCVAATVLVAGRSELEAARRDRAAHAPGAATLGLRATLAEREEWARVLDLTRGQRPVLLSRVEGAALLFPGFAPPAGAYFAPGHPLPPEIRRKADQVASARMVVLVGLRGRRDFECWPALIAAFDGCEPLWEGREYRVYRRTRPPGSGRIGSRTRDGFPGATEVATTIGDPGGCDR